MKVKDIMITKVITIQKDTPVSKVAELLFEHDLTGLPVVDDKNNVVGIVTEHDLMTGKSHVHLPTYINLLDRIKVEEDSKEKLNEHIKKILSMTAEHIMTTPVVSVVEDATVEDVVRIFSGRRINPIPVVDDNRSLVGIVSRADIVKLFIKK